MFLREVVTGQKSGSPVRYAQIVESYRDEAGKSRHRVLMSLGRVDRIDKDQVRKLITSLARYLETGKVPSGGRLGEVREFGVPFLADQLWSRLGLPEFFARQLRKRKYEVAVERALFAMVAHRLADPSSKRACAEWLALDAWIPGARGLTAQHLYRCMDFLDATHEDVEVALYQHRRTLFDRANVVYFDTTSTYFECDDAGEPDEDFGLRQYGYSRDVRPDRRQIVVGLATDQQGLPLVSDVFSGDTTDALTVAPMLARLKTLGLTNVVWITDRGMASDVNLSAVRAAGLRSVVGARLRPDDALRTAISADETPYARCDDGVMAKELRVAGRRVVVCFNPASAERDHARRAAAIDRLGPVLAHVNAGGDAAEITTNGWHKRLASRHADGTFALDKNKLEKEAQCDGTYVLDVSDDAMSAAEAARAYVGLLKVERAFRVLKHGLDIRPVYHRLDRRIRAHVTLCMLGYLLERVVEVETKMTFESVRKLFARLRAAELVFDEQRVWETSVLSPETRKILSFLRLDAPPRVLPNSP